MKKMLALTLVLAALAVSFVVAPPGTVSADPDPGATYITVSGGDPLEFVSPSNPDPDLANALVTLSADLDLDGIYETVMDQTTINEEIEFTVTPFANFEGTAKVSVAGSGAPPDPDVRPREVCWWVDAIQDWVCMYL